MRLSMLGLPVIQSLEDFSRQTHISKHTIFQLSKFSNKYYQSYGILKKNGKIRTINQPSKKLKGLQAWILVNILDKLKVSNSCKGFEKGSSTLNNAEPHKHANAVLIIDLKDFFPSIKRYMVFNIFKSIGYNNIVATIFTNLCIYNDELPQGSPCSPKLANLATWALDLRIQGYVGRRGITFTRYADDLTFSSLSPESVIKIIPTLKEIIEDENFKINSDKPRVSGPARAKKVTGLVISENSVGVGKQKFKIIRSKIQHLIFHREQTNLKLLSEVKGWLAYLKSVDEVRYKSATNYIRNLQDKHPSTLISHIPIPPKTVAIATGIISVS